MEAKIEAHRLGLGVGYVPENQVAEDVATGRLVGAVTMVARHGQIVLFESAALMASATTGRWKRTPYFVSIR